MKEQFDQETLYCRKLGHHLSFKYCRAENFDKPCAAIERCWQHKISVTEYLKNNFENVDLGYLNEERPQKVASLVELIEQAKARMEQ